MADDLEGLGNALKMLRDIFTELAKLAATVETTTLFRLRVGDDFTPEIAGLQLMHCIRYS